MHTHAQGKRACCLPLERSGIVCSHAAREAAARVVGRRALTEGVAHVVVRPTLRRVSLWRLGDVRVFILEAARGSQHADAVNGSGALTG